MNYWDPWLIDGWYSSTDSRNKNGESMKSIYWVYLPLTSYYLTSKWHLQSVIDCTEPHKKSMFQIKMNYKYSSPSCPDTFVEWKIVGLDNHKL